MVTARKETALEAELELTREQLWADFEAAMGDALPERVYPEDTTWFCLAGYIRRYGRSEALGRADLESAVKAGKLDKQLQRRGTHNVICYRPRKTVNEGLD